MNFKRNFKKLIKFKKEMAMYAHLEKTDIKSILKWIRDR